MRPVLILFGVAVAASVYLVYGPAAPADGPSQVISAAQSTQTQTKAGVLPMAPRYIVTEAGEYLKEFDGTTWRPFMGELFVEDGSLGVKAKSGVTPAIAEKLCSALSGYVFDQTRNHGLSGVIVDGPGGRMVDRQSRNATCAAL